MQPDTAGALYDMLRFGGQIKKVLEGRDAAALESDSMACYALERLYTLLGEALVRIRKKEPEVFLRIPDAVKIVGLRNILVHAYYTVPAKALWSYGQEPLSELLLVAGVLLSKFDETQGGCPE